MHVSTLPIRYNPFHVLFIFVSRSYPTPLGFSLCFVLVFCCSFTISCCSFTISCCSFTLSCCSFTLSCCRERLKPFPLFPVLFLFVICSHPTPLHALRQSPASSPLCPGLCAEAKKKLDEISSSLKDGGYLLSHLV